MEEERIPGWHNMDPFERTIAVFAYDCRDRIKSYQHPLAREFFIPPIILCPETEDNRLFQLDLYFPCRSIIPSDDHRMDRISFMLFRNPATPQEAEYNFECYHGDREDADDVISDFGGTFSRQMFEWDGDRRALFVPSAKLKCEITTVDDRDVLVDAEDWFDSCLHWAAARPRKFPHRPIIDLLSPVEEAADAPVVR